jgi:hypothetical protein
MLGKNNTAAVPETTAIDRFMSPSSFVKATFTSHLQRVIITIMFGACL